MGVSRIERILILAKTYPSPSAQYVETSCVAGITQDGCMRRLYPVPFRLIEENKQFKKWQWVDVRVEKASKDRRPESHKVYVDTVACGDHLDTKHAWQARRAWLEKIPCFDSVVAMDDARLADGVSLALLRPGQTLGLVIKAARNAEWTDEEKQKLTHDQMELFTEDEAKQQIRELRKVPFDFYYRHTLPTPDGEREYLHKIIDWEAGALYWKCRQTYGGAWEAPFRAKLETDLAAKDLMFLMGNLHRFQDQWMIISLVYPPKLAPGATAQGSLF